MSSTNRGAVRAASDFYVTPVEDVETFLREWAKDEPALRSMAWIMDPCAGGVQREGKTIVPMSYPEALHICPDLFGSDATVTTFDIRPDSLAGTVGDWLTRPTPSLKPHLIISNPPFSLAVEFIKKALAEVQDGGFVVFLSRTHKTTNSEDQKPIERNMNLICACCAGNAPAKKQWPNRDTGYGVCSRCFEDIVKREGFEAAVRHFGRPGIHHSTDETDRITLYAVTHIGKDGMRTLTFTNQGRNHHATREEAQGALDAIKESLREKILGDVADTLEVRPVKCYHHGDAVGIYFDTEHSQHPKP